MKRTKSCSTLRLKAHQLLNDEEKEILKYAIRLYRKNQSVDGLCDVLSRIITDANRSCLVAIIADMLKEEQRSQFLHRCYTKMPGYNMSQQQLTKSELLVNNTDLRSSNLSLKAATFVSKHRVSQLKGNATIRNSFDDCHETDSTIKFPTKKLRNYCEGTKRNNLPRSDSEELLKSIERCTLKERPRLANLQDKGFWYQTNESATDDDSTHSYPSSQEKEHIKEIEFQRIPMVVPTIQQTPRFYSNIKGPKISIQNGGGIVVKNNKNTSKLCSNSPIKQNQKDPKFMVCKLHFSSVENLHDITDKTTEIPVYLESLANVMFHLNSSNNFAINYDMEIPNYFCPNSVFRSDLKEAVENYPVVMKNTKIRKNPGFYQPVRDNQLHTFLTDEGSQTSPILTRDSTTQTFLA